MRDGTRRGRRRVRTATSDARAARFAERTEAKVAIASTSVPPAVESEAIVVQSGDTQER
jgi:hypothetical protein